MPFLKLVSIQPVTLEMFVRYEASPQESLGTMGGQAARGAAPHVVATSPPIGARTSIRGFTNCG